MASKMTPFERIAHEAIVKAENVTCSFDDFVIGLRSILHDINDRLSSAESELDSMRKVDESEEDK